MKQHIIDSNIVLEGSKVILRPLRSEDLKSLKELADDESLWIWFTHDLSQKKDFKLWADEALLLTKEKKRLAFAVFDKEQDKIAGSTSFGNISYRDKRLEIGWTWLGRSFHGSGINDQMKSLMLEYCFEHLNFERVELKTDLLNAHARKAMLRNGFKEEGILRSHTLMTHNRRRDTIYYSMLKSEWKALNNKP